MMANRNKPPLFRIIPLAACAAVVAAMPARAAMSDWASSEGGRMRVVALSPEADGTVRAGLQIEPAPGWITYWREPGDSGIPPQLTVAPGGNIALTSIAYPTPKPITIGTVREIGYDGNVTLPLGLTLSQAGQPAKLDLSVFIGLCKDICIPFQADLSLALPAESQFLPQEQGVIEAAAASLPSAPTPDFSVGSHMLSADGKSLSLQLMLPDDKGEAPQIYLTGPSGYAFFTQQNAHRDGRKFSSEIAIGTLPKGYDIKGKQWGLLVVDGARSMETTLAFN